MTNTGERETTVAVEESVRYNAVDPDKTYEAIPEGSTQEGVTSAAYEAGTRYHTSKNDIAKNVRTVIDIKRLRKREQTAKQNRQLNS